MAFNPSEFLALGPTGPAGLSSLKGLQVHGRATRNRRTLAEVAVETEALFLTHLLEQLRKSMVKSFATKSSEIQGYQSLADQHLAKTLALGGGLGLARHLFNDLGDRLLTSWEENKDGIRQAPENHEPVPSGDLPLSGAP